MFITGTDTGAGKTRIACAVLRGLAADGLRAVGMKPVASGVDPGQSYNADVAALVAASNVTAPLEDINPYLFAPPIAPHIAALQSRTTIDLETIAVSHSRLADLADVVVVEGAGGAMTPVSERFDMLDIAVRLGLPVVLVVGVRLGCINHALLTAAAIDARGLRFAGWIANRLDPSMLAADANVATLADRLPAPLIADVPWRRQDAKPLRSMLKFCGTAAQNVQRSRM